MTIPLEHIRQRAKQRPEGYYDDVVSRGVVVGDNLEITEADWRELAKKYRPPPPTMPQLLKNFAAAVARAAMAGFPIVSEDTFLKRLETCQGCEYWEKFGGLEIMRCRKCGCLKGKLWLGTETCPIGKWPSV